MSEASVEQELSLESLVAEAADDFRKRQQAGEQPDIEEYAARWPQAAVALRQVLASLQLLEIAAADQPAPEEAAKGELGDYRILREVGRGGMGVVYEAEQISLGRRVALKVLPFAATMDNRQLQRFHNEARAAACLQHPHIVPVHAVGCTRGVHYYAMQFIDGQSLDALLRDMRREQKPKENHHAERDDYGSHHAPRDEKPAESELTELAPPKNAAVASSLARRDTVQALNAQSSTWLSQHQGRHRFRRIAELALQAAEALEHAHQSGVVHRDVKPANLLLDDTGNVWITDFGLAQVQSDTRLTLTGDLMGTLRYMSPEQALAKRVIVDHRTDIYSLGATLYELVTHQPAFLGQDRQELLRQIAFEEPVPPRRVDRSIPVELETIVAKAMEKNPADRYATAREMADDLKRFLKDEPTMARRPSLWQRGRKWGRRHVAAVRATAAASLALVVMLAGCIGWVAGDRAVRRTEAESRVAEAVEVAKARLLLGNPYDPELVTAARKAEAQLATGLVGDKSRRQVEQVLADLAMLARLEEIRLGKADVTDGRFDIVGADAAYEKAFRSYGIDVKALAVEEAAAQVRQRTIGILLAAALDNWAMAQPKKEGQRRQQLLEVAQAADPDPWRCSLRQALAVGQRESAALEKLVASAPIEKLAPATLVVFGVALQNSGATPLAVNVLRKAQQLYPGDFWINQYLGQLLVRIKPPQVDEGIGFYRAALALRSDSPGVHVNLANALRNKGRLDDAIAWYQAAIRLNKDYAEAHYGLGGALNEQGRLDDAIASFQAAIRLKSDYAEAHDNLGIVLAEKRQWDDAIASFQAAIRLRPNYAGAHYNLANTLRSKGRPDDAIASYQAAIRLKSDFAAAHYNLGVMFLRVKGQNDDAIACFRAASRFEPNNAKAHNLLSWLLLSSPDKKLRDPKQALVSAKKAVQLDSKSGEYLNTLGIAYYRNGEWQLAVDSLSEASTLLKQRVTANQDGLFFLAMAHWRLGDKDQARSCYEKAVTWMAEKMFPAYLAAAVERWRAEAAELLGIDPGINPRKIVFLSIPPGNGKQVDRRIATDNKTGR